MLFYFEGLLGMLGYYETRQCARLYRWVMVALCVIRGDTEGVSTACPLKETPYESITILLRFTYSEVQRFGGSEVQRFRSSKIQRYGDVRFFLQSLVPRSFFNKIQEVGGGRHREGVGRR